MHLLACSANIPCNPAWRASCHGGCRRTRQLSRGLTPCSRTSERQSSFNFQYVQQLSNPRGSTATTGLSATSGIDVVPNTSPIRSGIPALREFRTSTTTTFSKARHNNGRNWIHLSPNSFYIYILSVFLIQTSWLFTVKNDGRKIKTEQNAFLVSRGYEKAMTDRTIQVFKRQERRVLARKSLGYPYPSPPMLCSFLKRNTVTHSAKNNNR